VAFSYLKSLKDLLEILSLGDCDGASGLVLGYFRA